MNGSEMGVCVSFKDIAYILQITTKQWPQTNYEVYDFEWQQNRCVTSLQDYCPEVLPEVIPFFEINDVAACQDVRYGNLMHSVTIVQLNKMCFERFIRSFTSKR